MDPARLTLRRRRVSWLVLGTLVALVVVASAAHLWALHRDLPMQDPDESAFVGPAVRIAATGDLNPHWFGHPGSTVIYPLAGFFHVWDALFHQGPLVSSHSALTSRLHRFPTDFYVIGRLWSIALSVAALPLLFAVGPADGFGEKIRAAAAFTLSLGKMTLAHELARIVLLEQLYRGFAILKGHPYHLGH